VQWARRRAASQNVFTDEMLLHGVDAVGQLDTLAEAQNPADAECERAQPCVAGGAVVGGRGRVWKDATSQADPRRQQDWFLKRLQGG
jgi:hypothetical protein